MSKNMSPLQSLPLDNHEGISSKPLNRTLYVGNISDELTESDIRGALATSGTVLSVHIKHPQPWIQSVLGGASASSENAHKFKARRYGLVTMASHEEAKASITQWSAAKSDAETATAFTIDWAHENSVLMISNLPTHIELPDIHQQFGEYGQIDEAASDEGVRKQGIWTSKWIKLRFMDRQGAIRARRAFDRSLIGGQHIRVNWHCSETPNNEAALKLEAKPDKFPLSSETDLQGGVKERSPTSVYFRFENLNEYEIGESHMRSIFSLYAPVDEVAVNESYIDAESGHQRGYGFVHFTNDEAGRAAVLAASRELKRCERLGVLVSAEVSNTFRRYMGEQQQQNLQVAHGQYQVQPHEHGNYQHQHQPAATLLPQRSWSEHVLQQRLVNETLAGELPAYSLQVPYSLPNSAPIVFTPIPELYQSQTYAYGARALIPLGSRPVLVPSTNIYTHSMYGCAYIWTPHVPTAPIYYDQN